MEGVQAWNEWHVSNPDIIPDLSGLDLSNWDLRHAELMYASLDGCNLSGADAREANFYGANFHFASLRDADFSHAKLIHALILRTSCERAKFTGANLEGALLLAAELQGADFRGANLNVADLREAWCSGALLTGATLIDANLSSSDLTDADLSGANLERANLDRAHLLRTKLIGARCGGTVFGSVDFRYVDGLETMVHSKPSTIGIQALVRSGVQVPEVFLRGAGVPEIFISHLKALIGAIDPIQFYSCFISYSTKDQEFASRLHADLQSKGVRCWFAPHDIRAGKKIHEQIDEAIRIYDRLLLILSPASMGSEWVKTEIAKARKQEIIARKRMLFPLRLVDFETLRNWECFDSDTGKDSAREIREYFIPDFSSWRDHDSYVVAF